MDRNPIIQPDAQRGRANQGLQLDEEKDQIQPAAFISQSKIPTRRNITKNTGSKSGGGEKNAEMK